jgi:hypothetical protein
MSSNCGQFSGRLLCNKANVLHGAATASTTHGARANVTHTGRLAAGTFSSKRSFIQTSTGMRGNRSPKMPSADHVGGSTSQLLGLCVRSGCRGACRCGAGLCLPRLFDGRLSTLALFGSQWLPLCGRSWLITISRPRRDSLRLRSRFAGCGDPRFKRSIDFGVQAPTVAFLECLDPLNQRAIDPERVRFGGGMWHICVISLQYVHCPFATPQWCCESHVQSLSGRAIRSRICTPALSPCRRYMNTTDRSIDSAPRGVDA